MKDIDRLAWFRFFPSDWLTAYSVRRMTATQRGYYVQLLAESWEQEPRASLPVDHDEIAFMAGAKDWDDFVANGGLYVMAQFVEESGRLYNGRLKREHDDSLTHKKKIVRARRAAGKKSAELRNAQRLAPIPINQQNGNKCSTNVEQLNTPNLTLPNLTLPNTKDSSPKNGSDAQRVYQAYPRKLGKTKAIKAIESACKRLQNGELDDKPMTRGDALIFLEQRCYAFARAPAGQKGEYTPHPATWFNRSSYLDNEEEWYSSATDSRSNGLAETLRQIDEA